jgi:hypothetical protein
MEYYKVRSSVFGNETVYSKELLDNTDLCQFFMNFMGELAIELIFWEKIEDQWVRITRKEFAKRFHIYCEIGGHEGDIILKGAESEPVGDSVDTLMFNPNKGSSFHVLSDEQKATLAKMYRARKYSTSDGEQVTSLLKSAGYPVTNEYLEENMKKNSDDKYQVYVVEQNGLLTGVVAFSLDPSESGTSIDVLIDLTAVDAEKDHIASYKVLLQRVHLFARDSNAKMVRAKQIGSFSRPELELPQFKYTRQLFSNIITGLKPRES